MVGRVALGEEGTRMTDCIKYSSPCRYHLVSRLRRARHERTHVIASNLSAQTDSQADPYAHRGLYTS